MEDDEFDSKVGKMYKHVKDWDEEYLNYQNMKTDKTDKTDKIDKDDKDEMNHPVLNLKKLFERNE